VQPGEPHHHPGELQSSSIYAPGETSRLNCFAVLQVVDCSTPGCALKGLQGATRLRRLRRRHTPETLTRTAPRARFTEAHQVVQRAMPVFLTSNSCALWDRGALSGATEVICPVRQRCSVRCDRGVLSGATEALCPGDRGVLSGRQRRSVRCDRDDLSGATEAFCPVRHRCSVRCDRGVLSGRQRCSVRCDRGALSGRQRRSVRCDRSVLTHPTAHLYATEAFTLMGEGVSALPEFGIRRRSCKPTHTPA
jgi:hypothetical protein